MILTSMVVHGAAAAETTHRDRNTPARERAAPDHLRAPFELQLRRAAQRPPEIGEKRGDSLHLVMPSILRLVHHQPMATKLVDEAANDLLRLPCMRRVYKPIFPITRLPLLM